MILRLLLAIVRATPPRMRALVCRVLIGHIEVVTIDDDLHVACEVCGHRSPGVASEQPAFTLTYAGDPRRREAYARKGIVRPEPKPQPEPLDDDWFADEHFQGGHARVI